MIIFNKRELSSHLTSTQTSTSEGYTSKILPQHKKKVENKKIKVEKSNTLSKTNQEFLQSLGFELKNQL